MSIPPLIPDEVTSPRRQSRASIELSTVTERKVFSLSQLHRILELFKLYYNVRRIVVDTEKRSNAGDLIGAISTRRHRSGPHINPHLKEIVDGVATDAVVEGALQAFQNEFSWLTNASRGADSSSASGAESKGASETVRCVTPPPQALGVRYPFFRTYIFRPYVAQLCEALSIPAPSSSSLYQPQRSTSAASSSDPSQSGPSVQSVSRSGCGSVRSDSVPPKLRLTQEAETFAQNLFNFLDADADGTVCWDDFIAAVVTSSDSHEGGGGGFASHFIAGVAAERQSAQQRDEPNNAMMKLADQPALRDPWQQRHPLVRYLYHRDIITHLVWSHAAQRYITGGFDGLVKLWRSEAVGSENHVGPRAELHGPVLLHDRHLLTLSGPVTDLCLSPPSAGNSEVVAVTSTDGTVTLLRTSTGEMVRTLRGVRGEAIHEEVYLPSTTASPVTRSGSSMGWRPTSVQSPLRARGGGISSHAGRSRHLAADSDIAVVRRPMYAVRAYREEARDVFAGPSNAYFHGLHAVAPTYEHLNPPDFYSADVLVGFGVHPHRGSSSSGRRGTARPQSRDSSPVARPNDREWYAMSVAIGTPRQGWSARRASLEAPVDGVYLFLGFECGLLQVYVLPIGWFAMTQHAETRLEPPATRYPLLTTTPHQGGILHINVDEASDLVTTVSIDGTIALRAFSNLQAPQRMLGVVVPPFLRPGERSSNVASSSAGDPHVYNSDHNGHSRRIMCSCFNAEHHLLVTGGVDYLLCWWSTISGSSSAPTRTLSLRARDAPRLRGTHGGFPVDISFFYRSSKSSAFVSAPGGWRRGGGGSHKARLLLLVLDSEQVVRIFDALTAQLLHMASAEMHGAALANALPNGSAHDGQRILMVRYDGVCGADRLLIGQSFLRTWDIEDVTDTDARSGHVRPILFIRWSAALRTFVTADELCILLWNATPTPQLPSSVGTEADVSGTKTDVLEAPSLSTQVWQTWRISGGIRAMSLYEPVKRSIPLAAGSSKGSRTSSPETSETTMMTVPGQGMATPSIFVALLHEPLIVQYSCTVADPEDRQRPTVLRAFCLTPVGPNGVSDGVTRSITAVTVSQVLKRASAASTSTMTAVLCVGYDITSLTEGECGRVAIYPMHGDDTEGRPNPFTDPPQLPSRVARLPRSGVSSIVVMLRSNCFVMGGRGVVYTAPMSTATAAVTPCLLLDGSTSPCSSKSSCGRSVGNLGATTTDGSVLLALVPGPIAPLPAVVWKKIEACTARQRRSVADPSVAETASEDSNQTSALAFFDAQQASLSGYVSHLVPVPNTTSLLCSGSNDGVVQLWDSFREVEVARLRVVLTGNPITALTLHSCQSTSLTASSTAPTILAAVGDELGNLTLLDLSDAVQEWEQTELVADEGVWRKALCIRLWDRWHAHPNAVTGICFTTSPTTSKADAAPTIAIFTAGEDGQLLRWHNVCVPATLTTLRRDVAAANIYGTRVFASRTAYRTAVVGRRSPFPAAVQQQYELLRLYYMRQRVLREKTELREELHETTIITTTATTSTDNGVVIAAKSLKKVLDFMAAEVEMLVVSQTCPPTAASWCATLLHHRSTGAAMDDFPSLCSSTVRAGSEDKPSSDDKSDDMAQNSSTVIEKGRRRRTLKRAQLHDDDAAGAAVSVDGASLRLTTASSYVLAFADGSFADSSVAECVQRTLTEVILTRGWVQGDGGGMNAQRLAAGGHGSLSAVGLTGSPLSSQRQRNRASLRVKTNLHSSTASGDPPSPVSLTVTASRRASTAVMALQMSSTPTSLGGSLSRAPSFSNSAPPRSPPSASLSPTGVEAEVPGFMEVPRSEVLRVPFGDATPRIRATAPISGRYGSPGLVRASMVGVGSAEMASGVSRSRERSIVTGNSPGDDDDEDDETVVSQYNRESTVNSAVVVQRIHQRRRKEQMEQQQHLGSRRTSQSRRSSQGFRKPASPRAVSSAGASGDPGVGSPLARAKQENRDGRRVYAPGEIVAAPTPWSVGGAVSDLFLDPVLQEMARHRYLREEFRKQCHEEVLEEMAVLGGTAEAGAAVEETEEKPAAPLDWYAARDQKRRVQREKNRLWNPSRVLLTLMNWDAPFAEFLIAPRATAIEEPNRDEDDEMAATLESRQRATAMLSNSTSTALSLTLPQIALALPPIVPPSTNCRSVVTVDKEGPESEGGAPTTLHLPSLLYVSPTTAIDGAIPPGLPTRAVLVSEVEGMKERMRESVRLRGIYQHKHNTQPLNMQRPSLEVPDGNRNGTTNNDGDEEEATFNWGSPSADAFLNGSQAIQEEKDGQETGVSAVFDSPTDRTPSPSCSSAAPSPHGVKGRRSITMVATAATTTAGHLDAEKRTMATVTLPTPITRRELFSRSPRIRQRLKGGSS